MRLAHGWPSAGGCALLISYVLVAAPSAAQQQYPSQAITIVVAAAAGGFADGVARTIGDRLGERLGQRRRGREQGRRRRQSRRAGPLRSRHADGHTMLVSTTSMAINGTLYKSMGYATEDIRPVAIVGSAPETIVVHPGNPARNPRRARAGGEGARASNTAAPGWEAVPSSRRNICSRSWPRCRRCTCRFQAARLPSPLCSAITSAPLRRRCRRSYPHINSGALRGLGIASAQPAMRSCRRFPPMPRDGFPDFHAASWVGFFVPSKTRDDPVVDKLNADDQRHPRGGGRAASGSTRFGLAPMYGGPAETARFFKSEAEHWGRMVRALGLSDQLTWA